MARIDRIVARKQEAPGRAEGGGVTMSQLTAETLSDADVRMMCAWLERMRLDAHLAQISSPCTDSLHREWSVARERCAELVNYINALSGKETK